ncbi:nitroreductase/quinone reductase family protein [Rhodococcus koreensis]
MVQLLNRTPHRRIAGAALRRRPGRAFITWLAGTQRGRKVDLAVVKLTGKSLMTYSFTAMNSLDNLDVLIIHTIGRKTGEPRSTAIPYFRVDDGLYVIASAGGQDANPAWIHNLRATQGVSELTINRIRRPSVGTELPANSEERTRVWDRIISIAPVFSDYQSKTTRILPVIRFEDLPPHRGRGKL